jgi:WD40 repeat protein
MGFSRRALLGRSVALGTGFHLGERRVRAQSARYTVRDLGGLTDEITRGIEWFEGDFNDINENGEVGGGLVASPEKVSPVVWSAEGKRIRLTSGRFGGKVRALNSSGLAVGLEYLDVLGIPEGDGWDEKYLPAAWQNGRPLALAIPEIMDADPAHLSGVAFDTNEDGQIVGYLSDLTLERTQPLIWRDGAIETLLPVSELGESVGYYINASGSVAGAIEHVQRFPDGYALRSSYPTLWTGGKLEVLDLPNDAVFPQSLDEDFSVSLNVFGLSDDALLLICVGTYSEEDTSYRSYLYDRGTWTPLLSPSDDYPEILARAISPTGVVVGTVGAGKNWDSFGNRRQVVWIDGSARDITRSLPDQGDLDVLRLLAINSNGTILANAYDADHAYHGLVLTPK